MPYELYALLDLGPLKKTKDVFTTADLGIVAIEGIAEDAWATRNSKGSTPQVFLGRPFLKTAGFQLDYIIETFSFRVENAEEILHPVKPPASFDKSAHQVELGNEGYKERQVVSKIGNHGSEDSRRRTEKDKGLRHAPPQKKKKKKDPMKHTPKKRRRREGRLN
ncbi:hypothetical protein PIB30_061920 [Stylosanthes scabra]|uniref:Uncharacterized protein n=1 Tax=Stylosanthes scabra TaxID=79078 RepID=A0ABU6ZJP3_9FABA|nr:hypothetical protein [Stylosanthes scabra]